MSDDRCFPAVAGLLRELPMQLVEERAPDGFDDIGEVITPEEIADVAECYRATAGFSLAALQRGTSLVEDPYPL
jgi:5-methylphenazine-1-carboxylate 1-monooxygenase